MSVEKIKVYADDLIQNAMRIMKWEGLKHVCVFNQQNELVGTLHFDDVRLKENQDKSVEEVMHCNFHKIYGELDAEIGINAVVHEKDHCLPVYENKKIVGILNIENLFPYSEFN